MSKNNKINNNNNKCTKPCFHMDACTLKDHGKCLFAHSIEELHPIVCMFDKKCNKKDCTRFHPSFQTKEQYCEINKFIFYNEKKEKKEESEMKKESSFFFDPYQIIDEIEEVLDEIDQENEFHELQSIHNITHEISFLQFMEEMENVYSDEAYTKNMVEFEQELYNIHNPFTETTYEEHVY